MYYLTTHINQSPIRLCKLQKSCTRLATTSDNVYQLLAHGRCFSPGTPASPTIKTGCQDIAEILLKVAFNTNLSNQIKSKGLFTAMGMIYQQTPTDTMYLRILCQQLKYMGVNIVKWFESYLTGRNNL